VFNHGLLLGKTCKLKHGQEIPLGWGNLNSRKKLKDRIFEVIFQAAVEDFKERL